jgi:metallophosphoesterase (TIGR00282 family)
MLKVIFIGDIVGKIGRKAVVAHLPVLKKKYQPDLVIANVENLAHGIGFTQKTLDEIFEAGVDLGTGGNHSWSKAGSEEILNAIEPRVIRPANFTSKKTGVGYLVLKIAGSRVVVTNLIGQIFINDEEISSPFTALEEIIAAEPKATIIVDMHAEATSEKAALAHAFDGRVAAVIGTHTHVPTADARVLPGGTGLVTDAGMVGYYDSVIGASKSQIVAQFTGKGPAKKKHDQPETGECQFNAVYLEIDTKKHVTSVIQRLDAILTVN